MPVYTSQVQIAKNTTYGDLAMLSDREQANTTWFTYEEGALAHSTPVFARARQFGPYGTSAWSPTVSFMLAPPANIVGICHYKSGGRIGDFRRIDGSGNFLSEFEYKKHPIYLDCMRDVIIDGCRMKEFDTLYVKTAYSGPSSSDSAGKPCWWISDKPYPDFHPMATFLRGGVVKKKIWIGTYLCHQETVREATSVGSLPGQIVKTGITKSSFKQYINNRNDGSIGISGFRPFDIWDLSLLRLVLLIFGGGSDVQYLWGDNKEGTLFPKTGSTGASALGIHDLWRCYWYHVYMVHASGTSIQLTDPSTGETLTTECTLPTKDGWVVDIHRGEHLLGGELHDYMEYFLPKTVTDAEPNGTFADYYRVVNNKGLTTGHSVSGGGTQQRNYWTNYQRQCPHYSYVPAVSRQSYWDVYKERCNYRENNGSVSYADGTYKDHYAPFTCPNSNGWYNAKQTETGHSATCSRKDTVQYLGSAHACKLSEGNTTKVMIGSTFTRCPVCGQNVYETYPNGKYQSTCTANQTCAVKYYTTAPSYKCTWYGPNTTALCYGAQCEHWWQGSSPATTKCAKTSGVCLLEKCDQTYTVDATVQYSSEAGLFACGPETTDAYTAVRLAKS